MAWFVGCVKEGVFKDAEKAMDGDTIGNERTIDNGRTIGNERTIPVHAGSALGHIDQYELLKELGGGGFGTVYLAKDTVFGIEVAVKGLPLFVRNNREEMENIRSNFALVSRLTHTNIAKALVLHPAKEVVYESEDVRKKLRVDSGDTLMVMEYAPGVTLSQWRRQFPDRKVPLEQALEITRQIASALDYAHELRVVHRDIKPANMMIETAEDGSVKVRVLDFGLAAEIRSSMGRVSREIHDTSGTRPYMAPEQWLGAKQGPATDQYSLAAMFCELVTGEVPFASVFDTGDPVVMMNAVGREPFAPSQDLPKPIRLALSKALAKRPEERFASCGDFVAALEGRGFSRKERKEAGGQRLVAAVKGLLAAAALGLAAFGGRWWMSGREGTKGTQGTEETIGTNVTNVVQVSSVTQVASPARERRAKWRKEGEQFTINNPYGLNMTMKWCPAGTFTMGSPPTEEGRYDDERQHEVTLTKGFWMGQTEVTQGQWKKIMGGETIVDLARKRLQDDTLYNLPGGKKTLREFWGMSRDGDPMNQCGDLKEDVPVYNVSWNEAVEFCRRLTQRERAEGRIPDGYEYRLPTEAEWEYACRAGTTSALPNGRDIRILGKNNAPALDDIAWYGGNSSVGFNGRGPDTSNWQEKQYSGGRASAREVKGKQPNRWGLYDMIGNVWEWCGDWYGDYPYGSATDPTGVATGAYRVNRGGGWYNDARNCRSAIRVRSEPGSRYDDLGFRVALAPSH